MDFVIDLEGEPMELNDYQRRANLTDQRPGQVAEEGDDVLAFPLMGIASEVGSLVTQYKKRVRDGESHSLFTDRISEKLGDILWYVANFAHKAGLELDDVADLNLKRIEERWPAEGSLQPAKLLDDAFPVEEQLPRQVSVLFEEVQVDGEMKLRISAEGSQLGNYLTDMNYDDDGYRFHDAFHLTYAALLGWSPISREFFGTKRRSNPQLKEIEDGGRAGVIEEAISAHVFAYAAEEKFLEGVPHLDSELLRNITGMVSHLEVRTRTVAEWERAIFRSFEVWRALRDHGGGTLHLDLRARTIKYEPPSVE
jgi:NTP pyrophosphatase (non-canonical NTP hydrolase)